MAKSQPKAAPAQGPDLEVIAERVLADGTRIVVTSLGHKVQIDPDGTRTWLTGTRPDEAVTVTSSETASAAEGTGDALA